MVAKNDITGDSIQTKGASENYRNNYDAIFRKKNTGVNQDILTREDCLYSETDKLTRYNTETQEAKILSR